MDLEKPEVEYNCYCAMCSNDPEAEMNLEKPEVEYNCYCAMCTNDPEAEMDLEKPEVEYNCYCAMCTNDPEAASEDEGEDETPTTSDEDFIVSDSEMEEVEQEDAVEDQIDLLFESFVNLQEEHKILKKELQKQSCLLFEIHQELKKKSPQRSEAVSKAKLSAERSGS